MVAMGRGSVSRSLQGHTLPSHRPIQRIARISRRPWDERFLSIEVGLYGFGAGDWLEAVVVCHL
jgi:hypothetical protein